MNCAFCIDELDAYIAEFASEATYNLTEVELSFVTVTTRAVGVNVLPT